MIRIHEVESSAISRIGYDDSHKALYIEFRTSGKVWVYEGVEYSLYSALLNAESIGRVFGERVRDKFPGREADMPAATPIVPRQYNWDALGPAIQWG